MSKINYPLRYITTDTLKKYQINLSSFPNAGPNCNVTGMRKLYWGTDAMLVKHGQYVYKVNGYIYHLAH